MYEGWLSLELWLLGFRYIFKNNKIIIKVNNKTKRKLKRKLNKNNISSYKCHLNYGNCNSLINKYLRL